MVNHWWWPYSENLFKHSRKECPWTESLIVKLCIHMRWHAAVACTCGKNGFSVWLFTWLNIGIHHKTSFMWSLWQTYEQFVNEGAWIREWMFVHNLYHFQQKWGLWDKFGKFKKLVTRKLDSEDLIVLNCQQDHSSIWRLWKSCPRNLQHILVQERLH